MEIMSSGKMTDQEESVSDNQLVLQEIKLLRKEISEGLSLIFEHFKQEMRILQNDFRLEVASIKDDILRSLQFQESAVPDDSRVTDAESSTAEEDNISQSKTDSNRVAATDLASSVCAQMIQNACASTSQQLQDVTQIQSKLLELCGKKQPASCVFGKATNTERQGAATLDKVATESEGDKVPVELHDGNSLTLRQVAQNLIELRQQCDSDSHNFENYSKNVSLVKFTSPQTVGQHLAESHSHVFQCDRCDKVFQDLVKFHRHIQNHEIVLKQHRCRICGKFFSGKNGLRKHSQLHGKERRFQCTICNKGFAFQCDFTRHMRCHTGEKPFCCPTCGKCFKQKAHMQKHTELHSKSFVMAVSLPQQTDLAT